MYPKIKITDSLSLSSYSTLYVIAIILAIIVFYFEIRRYHLERPDLNLISQIPAIAFWTILGGIIGAKIFHIFSSAWNDFLASPIDVLTRGSGWMYYGAEIGGTIAILIYLLVHKIPLLRICDMGGLFLAISHSFGRFGCFMAGCCYGTPTDSFLGVTFPHRHIFTKVHPTQLYETVPLLILFSILWSIRKKIKTPGYIYAIYMMFYGALRFIVEFYRVSAIKVGIFNISFNQYIAIIQFIIGTSILIYLIRHTKLNSSKFISINHA